MSNAASARKHLDAWGDFAIKFLPKLYSKMN